MRTPRTPRTPRVQGAPRVERALRVLRADRPFSRLGDHGLLLALLLPSAFDTEVPATAPAVWLTACLAITAAVAVRRTAPLPSLLLAALLALFYPWFGASLWPAVAAAVLSWGAGRRLTRLWPAHAVFLGATAAGLLVVGALAEAKDGLSLLMIQFLSCVLPWWAGDWRRQRTALAHAGWQRAEQLEWRQRAVAEQARLKERARIAQEIHDSLGHELSVMALLAGGLELSKDLSEEHRDVLGQLRQRCSLATERLHEAIGLLREETAPALVPAHESVAQLVDRFERSAGPVDFHEEGAPPGAGAPSGRDTRRGEAAPSPSELAAYRVVQEALTNAAKHAPGAPVAVRVLHRPDETVVTIVNERPGGADRPSATGSGAGLIGLDERVRLAGGTLRTGPGPDGFEVHARLPHTPRVPQRTVDPATGVPGTGPVPGAASCTASGAAPFTASGAAPRTASGTAPPPERSASASALLRARTRLRRDARRAALLPALLGAGIVALLAGLYAATSTTTSVTSEDYARIRLGETRADLEPLLPARRIGRPPPVIPEPLVPPGATCEYYRASENLLDFGDTMYRLCFTDDVLVAKDTL
ncbi:sensor histidine kinase [Streptomyces pactum]|uniref:histidine kinase n=1 Tax=Streptomyces pactum TaxID=68249 RepID=A0A1S6JJ86_9ACTN|nr:sensor histidine kinase [Streptomyces pactum]